MILDNILTSCVCRVFLFMQLQQLWRDLCRRRSWFYLSGSFRHLHWPIVSVRNICQLIQPEPPFTFICWLLVCFSSGAVALTCYCFNDVEATPVVSGCRSLHMLFVVLFSRWELIYQQLLHNLFL